jgi:hypothetical protein
VLLRPGVAAQTAGYGIAMDDVDPHLRRHEESIGMNFTAMKLEAIAAAHAAGLLAIAEGADDAGTWARMQARGVDAAQGVLIGRPFTAPAVPIRLADRRRIVPA